MKPGDNIIKELAGSPFSLKGFIRENLRGLLTSLIFHLLILVAFLIFKIDSLKHLKEPGVFLDFTYEMKMQEEESMLTAEELAKIELFERLLDRTLRASNQPANITEQLEKKISTENFVQEVEKQLDELRSEEEHRKLKELEEQLSSFSGVPPGEEADDLEHTPRFQGPTRISYQFHEPPFNRYDTYIPVPVYKCQGEGVVEVEIAVNQLGNVISAKPFIISSSYDADCLAETAVKFALLSKFSRNFDAPANHKGKIKYSFVAQ